MKKYLEKFSVFMFGLRIYAFFSRRRTFKGFTRFLTRQAALLNIRLNRPKPGHTPQELAERWQQLMPPDAQDQFVISRADDHTAEVLIKIHCPLRGTGDNHACHKLMNYDRTLMEQVGGQLIVRSSQSNSGEPHCLLAIRKAGADVSDLEPAWPGKYRR